MTFAAGTLLSQPFDAGRFVLGGSPSTLADQLFVDPVSATVAALSASTAGPVVYRTGSGTGRYQFRWIDRSGKELEKVGSAHDGLIPMLSPDGRHIGMARTPADGNTDVWVLEMGRNALSRFTYDGGADNNPVYSPDASVS